MPYEQEVYQMVLKESRPILFLSGEFDEEAWKEQVRAENKQAGRLLWRLRRIRITEIIVKILAFIWAVIWSVTSMLCLFSEGHELMMLLTALPAAAFWIVIFRSAGSVGVIGMQIRELKKEMREDHPQNSIF